MAGYIKHAGEPAEDLVQEGFSIAVKKLGVIGCRVRIIPPDVELPDDFRIVEPAAEASEQEEEPSRPTETEKPTLVEELEASEEGEAGAEQAPAESEDEMPAEPSEPKIELPEPTLRVRRYGSAMAESSTSTRATSTGIRMSVYTRRQVSSDARA